MSLISVKKLAAFYENREIFNDLSFDVADADYLYIVGENGSGKTTLMRCILGFNVKYTGDIALDGFSKKEIGYLPQRISSENDFPASVNEVIMSGFAGKSFLGFGYKNAYKKRAIENMQLLGIGELKDKPYSELSGGQQQKVLLCRALCAAKKALLLDEPVTGLDALSREEMYTLIDRLNKSGMTVIMISHDLDAALKNAKHILHISEGGYFYGTPDEYESSSYFAKLPGKEV